MKKQLITICIIFLFTNCIAQKIVTNKFKIDDKEINYSLVNFNVGYVQNFYVVLSNSDRQIDTFKSQILRCLSTGDRAYLVTIPKDINKEKFLLEFISHITNRSKLIDSNLIIIADDDYSNLYISTKLEKNNRYKHGYLNDIKQQHLFKDIKNVCDVIK